jgi:hypothetical protein
VSKNVSPLLLTSAYVKLATYRLHKTSLQSSQNKLIHA